jgi:hypothetical protein
MSVILLYFLAPIIILCIALYLNLYYKWITKQNICEITDYYPDEDMFIFGMCILLAIIAWPLFLFIGIIFGIVYLIPKIIHNMLPNDNPTNPTNPPIKK